MSPEKVAGDGGGGFPAEERFSGEEENGENCR